MKWLPAARLVVGLILAISTSRLLAEDAKSAEKASDTALWEWERALVEFRKAGMLIGAGEYETARLLLDDCHRRLPAPYGMLAEQYRDQLRSALSESDLLGGYYRLGRLGEVCMNLHAHAAATKLSREAVQAHPDDHYGHRRRIAWCLVESGDVKTGLSEYQKQLEATTASDWRVYYERQIELLKSRPEEFGDPRFALHFAFKRHLAGMEAPKDYFSALSELKRALPLAEREQDRRELHEAFIDLLYQLGDRPGAFAWEERTLQVFADNAEVCAAIYVRRGQKAYEGQDLEFALKSYLAVSEKYPASQSWGVAQFNVGWILKEQKKYPEAIAQFSKLYESAVNDQDPSPMLMETWRNYRHNAALGISASYEAMQDFGNALKHAELARDKYKFQSWCGTCAMSAEHELAKRIKRLQKLAQ